MFLALKQKLFGNANGSSKSARSRLHFVLVQDRTGLSSDEMAKFREEMVSVIEKYFMIDKSGFDIAYKRDSDTTTLLINSPVVVRRSKEKEAGSSKKSKHSADVAAPA